MNWLRRLIRGPGHEPNHKPPLTGHPPLTPYHDPLEPKPKILEAELNELKTINEGSKCPHCGFSFSLPPQRKRKCPDCSQTIVVRTANGEKSLLTPAGAAAFDEMLRLQKELRRKEDAETHFVEMRLVHQRTLKGYLKNKDVIKGVMIRAAGTGCPQCRALDGKQYTVGVALRDMPLPVKPCTYGSEHNGGVGWCRCTWLPITKTYRELGIDVPESQGTDEWLASLSDSEQERMLGARFEAWKSGRLTFDRSKRSDDLW